MWIDLTHHLSADTARWPGNPPVSIQTNQTDKFSESVLQCSTHSGTHIDAPSHFIPRGINVKDIPLSQLTGKAQVIQIDDEVILPHHLHSLTEQKILFKTTNKVSGDFSPSYVYIAPKAAKLLIKNGVHLIGTDYLSVEKYGNEEFPTHSILLSAGAIIIEGLDTSELNEGYYDIVALPLKIDAEASPARVIARPCSS